MTDTQFQGLDVSNITVGKTAVELIEENFTEDGVTLNGVFHAPGTKTYQLAESLIEDKDISRGKKIDINSPTLNYVTAPNLDASEESILKSWEGLGYYSRSRNFHKAAKIIIKNFNSKIPELWDDFRSLPGVGDYTAAAVLSIAFNKSYVAIDGNVKRVMARLTSRKKLSQYNLRFIKSKLLKFMDKNRAGDFNQAMMDFGSTVCKPKKSDCIECTFSSNCEDVHHNNLSYSFTCSTHSKSLQSSSKLPPKESGPQLSCISKTSFTSYESESSDNSPELIKSFTFF